MTRNKTMETKNCCLCDEQTGGSCQCPCHLPNLGLPPEKPKQQKKIEELYGIFEKVIWKQGGKPDNEFLVLTDKGANELLDKINEIISYLNGEK